MIRTLHSKLRFCPHLWNLLFSSCLSSLFDAICSRLITQFHSYSFPTLSLFHTLPHNTLMGWGCWKAYTFIVRACQLYNRSLTRITSPVETLYPIGVMITLRYSNFKTGSDTRSLMPARILPMLNTDEFKQIPLRKSSDTFVFQIDIASL